MIFSQNTILAKNLCIFLCPSLEKLTTHITMNISASSYAINNQAHYSIMSNLVQFFLKSDINFECFMISHKNDSTNRKTTEMNVQITKVWCKIIWSLFPISEHVEKNCQLQAQQCFFPPMI